MTIDDELLVELVKQDKGKTPFLAKIVGARIVGYRLEESTHYYKYYDTSGMSAFQKAGERELIKITPDITVLAEIRKEAGIGPNKIAFELENDIQWDFQESLRQVKRYKEKFPDIRLIIPDEYKRFAPLYMNEGLRVYLWKAKRIWQCMTCGNVTDKEGPIEPKCKECKKRTEHRLIGLKDTEFEEYKREMK